jgi:hypothetical protein
MTRHEDVKALPAVVWETSQTPDRRWAGPDALDWNLLTAEIPLTLTMISALKMKTPLLCVQLSLRDATAVVRDTRRPSPPRTVCTLSNSDPSTTARTQTASAIRPIQLIQL